jgi:hypothetical protein
MSPQQLIDSLKRAAAFLMGLYFLAHSLMWYLMSIVRLVAVGADPEFFELVASASVFMTMVGICGIASTSLPKDGQ